MGEVVCVSLVVPHLFRIARLLTMSSAAAPVKPEDVIVSEMKKASHDIEAQAVT